MAPGRPKQLLVPTPPSVAMPNKGAPLPDGTATLRDHTGKELNMDGTPKVPYMHPNFGQGKETTPNIVVQLEERQEEEVIDPQYRRGPNFPVDGRRNVLTIKPAKLNISEFDGQDQESWIQNLEQYFAAARTPIEHRTELAISYLKGPVVQWWRGTGLLVTNMPWHRFCSNLTEIFSYFCV